MTEPNTPRQIPSPRDTIKAMLDMISTQLVEATRIVDRRLSIYDEQRSTADARQLSPVAAAQMVGIDEMIEAYGRAAFYAGSISSIQTDAAWAVACDAKLVAERALAARYEDLLDTIDGLTSDLEAAKRHPIVWRYERNIGTATGDAWQTRTTGEDGVTWETRTSLSRPSDDPLIRNIVALHRSATPREIVQWATETLSQFPDRFVGAGPFGDDVARLRTEAARVSRTSQGHDVTIKVHGGGIGVSGEPRPFIPAPSTMLGDGGTITVHDKRTSADAGPVEVTVADKGAPPPPDTDPFFVVVGKSYRRRDGMGPVRIVREDRDFIWPMCGDNGEYYTENGCLFSPDAPQSRDLVAEWRDDATQVTP
jgi:hypothetical protein